MGTADTFLFSGFDAGAVTGGLEKEAIEDAAAAFLEERGPVQVFIFEENDSYQEYVFVPHADKRTPAADALLRTWHLTTLPPVRTHKYSRLRIVQLENLLPFDQWDHAKSQ